MCKLNTGSTKIRAELRLLELWQQHHLMLHWGIFQKRKSNEIFQLLVLHYCIKQVKERGKKELHQTTILHCLSNLLLKVICSKCRVTPCSLHVSLKVFALNLRLECTYLNNKLQKINNFTLKHNSISGIIHFWTNGSLTHK